MKHKDTMAEATQTDENATNANLTYMCDICGQDGLSENEMRSHVLIEHVEGQISCPFCDLDGTTLEEMNAHVNVQHLEHLTPTKESMSGSDLPMETMTESSNCDSLKSSETGKYSLMSTDSIETPRTDSAMSPISPMEITITEVQDSPKRHPFLFESDDARSMSSDGEQSLKRAKLYLNVPQGTGSKLSQAAVKLESKFISDTSEKGFVSKGGGSPDKYSCPMCSWSCESPNEITRHVNVQHLDALTPSKSHGSIQMQTDSENNNISSALLTASTSSRMTKDSPFECPLCGLNMDSGSSLELHVNTRHSDILSPANSQVQTPISAGSSNSSPQSSCPVCGMECSDSSSLQLHVDGHFSAEHTPGELLLFFV